MGLIIDNFAGGGGASLALDAKDKAHTIYIAAHNNQIPPGGFSPHAMSPRRQGRISLFGLQTRALLPQTCMGRGSGQ